MGGWTVVAFVEVVGEDLPVVCAVDLVRVVEDVVIEVDAFISLLSVRIVSSCTVLADDWKEKVPGPTYQRP